MRRLLIAVTLLVLVLCGAWGSTNHLGELTGQMSSLLTQAENLGENGDWESALSLTRQAETFWKDHAFYFHILLRHSDTDNITQSFREVKEFLRCQESGEYSAANAILIGRIDLLYEQERCTLKNLL